MTSLAIRLTELDDTELEQFIEIWVETKSRDYVRVERLGAANDKGPRCRRLQEPSPARGTVGSLPVQTEDP